MGALTLTLTPALRLATQAYAEQLMSPTSAPHVPVSALYLQAYAEQLISPTSAPHLPVSAPYLQAYAEQLIGAAAHYVRTFLGDYAAQVERLRVRIGVRARVRVS